MAMSHNLDIHINCTAGLSNYKFPDSVMWCSTSSCQTLNVRFIDHPAIFVFVALVTTNGGGIVQQFYIC